MPAFIISLSQIELGKQHAANWSNWWSTDAKQFCSTICGIFPATAAALESCSGQLFYGQSNFNFGFNFDAAAAAAFVDDGNNDRKSHVYAMSNMSNRVFSFKTVADGKASDSDIISQSLCDFRSAA